MLRELWPSCWTLVLGLLVLAWPEATLALIARLFGLYFVLSGLRRIARGVALSGGFTLGRPARAATVPSAATHSSATRVTD